MISHELQDQIKARIKEAEKKEIHSKASTIAHALGKGQDVFVFSNEDFEIESGGGVVGSGDEMMGWSTCTVKYRSLIVYEENGNTISCFIPGDWENDFYVLYDKSKIKQEIKHKELQLKNAVAQSIIDSQEKTKWGL